jgi:hypothetical protein
VVRRIKKTHRARKLLLGYLERISSRVFSDFPKELTDLVGKQHGIYSLYKGRRLYYVGLATDLKGRIKQHLRDKHAQRWDKFSLYLVRKADHIRELESLVMRVADPKGNPTKGRLLHAVNLGPKLEAGIREAQERQRSRLFGARSPSHRPPQTRKTVQKGKVHGQPTLADHVAQRFKIRAMHKGNRHEAMVLRDGSIRFEGSLYKSPSGAGKAAIGRAVDGWLFWRFKDNKGEWIPLDKLRKKY